MIFTGAAITAIHVCAYTRASIGGGRRVGGGDASPPLFSVGDSIGIVPPTFQLRNIVGHIA